MSLTGLALHPLVTAALTQHEHHTLTPFQLRLLQCLSAIDPNEDSAKTVGGNTPSAPTQNPPPVLPDIVAETSPECGRYVSLAAWATHCVLRSNDAKAKTTANQPSTAQTPPNTPPTFASIAASAAKDSKGGKKDKGAGGANAKSTGTDKTAQDSGSDAASGSAGPGGASLPAELPAGCQVLPGRKYSLIVCESQISAVRVVTVLRKLCIHGIKTALYHGAASPNVGAQVIVTTADAVKKWTSFTDCITLLTENVFGDDDASGNPPAGAARSFFTKGEKGTAAAVAAAAESKGTPSTPPTAAAVVKGGKSAAAAGTAAAPTPGAAYFYAALLERVVMESPSVNLCLFGARPPRADDLRIRMTLHRGNRRYLITADSVGGNPLLKKGNQRGTAPSSAKPDQGKDAAKRDSNASNGGNGGNGNGGNGEKEKPPPTDHDIVADATTRHCSLLCLDNTDRAAVCKRICEIATFKKIIVLTHNKEVQTLKSQLKAKWALQRSTAVPERQRTLKEFLAADRGIFVTMDAFCGIDLMDVDALIQCHPPQKSMSPKEWEVFLSCVTSTGFHAKPTRVFTLGAPDDLTMIAYFQHRVGPAGQSVVLNADPGHPQFTEIVMEPEVAAYALMNGMVE